MKNFGKFFVLLAAALVMAAPGAYAKALTSDDVGKFVSAIPDVESFSHDMEKQGKQKALEEAVKPQAGDKVFAPYSKGAEVLKGKFPEDYAKLGHIVGDHGFSSQEDWANTGDTVMTAYMAIQVEKQNPGILKNIPVITPEMKSKVNPDTLKQMEMQVNMLKLFAAVPQTDKDAVTPHMADIDGWLQRAEAEAKAAGTPPAAGIADTAASSTPAK